MTSRAAAPCRMTLRLPIGTRTLGAIERESPSRGRRAEEDIADAQKSPQKCSVHLRRDSVRTSAASRRRRILRQRGAKDWMVLVESSPRHAGTSKSGRFGASSRPRRGEAPQARVRGATPTANVERRGRRHRPPPTRRWPRVELRQPPRAAEHAAGSERPLAMGRCRDELELVTTKSCRPASPGENRVPSTVRAVAARGRDGEGRRRTPRRTELGGADRRARTTATRLAGARFARARHRDKASDAGRASRSAGAASVRSRRGSRKAGDQIMQKIERTLAIGIARAGLR